MDIVDRIKELVLTKYPEISVSDISGTLALHYSKCESYSDCLERLNDESLLISDDDYNYVVNFLQDLNNMVSICVVCSTDELNSKAYQTHYLPLKGLLSERSITFCDGFSQEHQDKFIVHFEIIASIKSSAQKVHSPDNSVFFTFISEKDSKGDETVATLPKSILFTFEENTKLWPRLDDKLPYQYLYDYVPTRFKNSEEDIVIDGQRRLIYSFKDGKLDWNDSSVLNIIATEIEDLIFKTFESDNLPFLTWFCIPPTYRSYDSISTNDKQARERFMNRFELLSERVCSKLNMKNGIRSVIFDDKGYSFISNDIIGSNIILFDDILTTGRSAIRIQKDLEREGAKVLCFISLEKTVLMH